MNNLIKIAVVLAFAVLAKGDDSAWQIVSQSQDFSVGFLE
nr:hypothetical protein HAGR004_37740 [Bdellovibrio sp. HAGR004]